jgi:hypothetical protein
MTQAQNVNSKQYNSVIYFYADLYVFLRSKTLINITSNTYTIAMFF